MTTRWSVENVIVVLTSVIRTRPARLAVRVICLYHLTWWWCWWWWWWWWLLTPGWWCRWEGSGTHQYHIQDIWSWCWWWPAQLAGQSRVTGTTCYPHQRQSVSPCCHRREHTQPGNTQHCDEWLVPDSDWNHHNSRWPQLVLVPPGPIPDTLQHQHGLFAETRICTKL